MLYEGGIREPMIVKWPGVTKPGSVCRENVIGVDFYPTLLEITKTPAPKDYSLDGLSLVPLLENPQAKLKRKAIYWHFPAYLQGTPFVMGISDHSGWRRPDGRLELIEFFEDGTLELYNTRKIFRKQRTWPRTCPPRLRKCIRLCSRGVKIPGRPYRLS